MTNHIINLIHWMNTRDWWFMLNDWSMLATPYIILWSDDLAQLINADFMTDSDPDNLKQSKVAGQHNGNGQHKGKRVNPKGILTQPPLEQWSFTVTSAWWMGMNGWLSSKPLWQFSKAESIHVAMRRRVNKAEANQGPSQWLESNPWSGNNKACC